jgi:glycosyltransferase involved in cell wall biosynthesis
MTEALTYLLANPEAAAQMGRNGRARVVAQFTIQRTARMVEAVYREVLRVPEQVDSSFATANS